MSRDEPWQVTSSRCFPRVSGDEPVTTYLSDVSGEFSPRERG